MSMILVDEKKLKDFIRAIGVDCYTCPVRNQARNCLQTEMSCVTMIELYLQNKLIKKEIVNKDDSR